MSSEVANCEGERCIQESQAKAQGAKMSLDAEYQLAHLNYLKQQMAIQEAEQRENMSYTIVVVVKEIIFL